MPTVILLGGGGHARVIVEALRARGDVTVLGYLSPDSHPGQLDGVVRLGSDQDLDCLEFDLAVVAIGENWTRSRVVEAVRARRPQMRFHTVIHPSSIVASNVTVEEGTVVMAGAVVQSGVRIGRHCVVNTGATVDHDVTLGDYASVGPGASLGGSVTVGPYAVIGIGSTVSHGVRVGEHSVVGAGSTVVRDVPESVVAYGVPCRVVRSRSPDEVVLTESQP